MESEKERCRGGEEVEGERRRWREEAKSTGREGERECRNGETEERGKETERERKTVRKRHEGEGEKEIERNK